MRRLVQLAIAAGLALALIGCSDGAETNPDPGTGGGGGSEPLECEIGDAFDPAECPATYPEWDCVVYVDSAVASSGDGWSWQSAVKTVQEGIDLGRCGALDGAVCEQWQVWVREGSYFIHQGCREHLVRLRPNVAVYGGFTGTETSLEERDWEANQTILDGRDGPEGDQTVYHVVYGADDAVLDGVFVQYGRADHPTDILFRNGAGMANVGSSPTVENCTFRHNTAAERAGAMLNHDQSSPIISSCKFLDNTAGQQGGALVSGELDSLVVSDSHFRGNTAHSGGALSVWGSSVSISRCTFVDNHAIDAGVNPWANAGAIGTGGEAEVSLSESSFADNTASGSGGAVAVGTGAVATIEDCVFSENETGNGGGAIIVWNGTAYVRRSAFVGNRAPEQNGGAMVVGEATFEISDSVLRDNTAYDEGGALGISASTTASVIRCEFRNNSAGDGGGGLAAWNDTPVEVVSSAFFNNSAASGGAVAIGASSPLSLLHCTVAHNSATGSGGAIWGAADLTIENSIIWGEADSLIAGSGSIAQTISHSDLPGGAAMGSGNIGATPAFIGPGRGDLRLESTSPCIDGADPDVAPATDMVGNFRVGAPDMGAYEYQNSN